MTEKEILEQCDVICKDLSYSFNLELNNNNNIYEGEEHPIKALYKELSAFIHLDAKHIAMLKDTN